jgi:hypothetical protein
MGTDKALVRKPTAVPTDRWSQRALRGLRTPYPPGKSSHSMTRLDKTGFVSTRSWEGVGS